jgi:hypothetical protein
MANPSPELIRSRSTPGTLAKDVIFKNGANIFIASLEGSPSIIGSTDP